MQSLNEVMCRMCKVGIATRIGRIGFMQRNVMSFLGFYPWKCGACGCEFLFRRRGYRVRARSGRSKSSRDESPQTER